MAMRVYVAFSRPVARPDRLRLSVSLGALAGCERVRWQRGDRAVEVLGEGLAKAKVAAALTEGGAVWEHMATSLTPEEDARLDEVGEGQERVKPPGR